MISLLPPTQTVTPLVDVPKEKRVAQGQRPWVLTNMVASIDGATALQGTSGGLGSTADRLQLVALRSIADAIIVGGSTVRSERYRQPQLTEAAILARKARGQADLPRLVVVTAQAQIDIDLPLFSSLSYRPLVITTENASVEQIKLLQTRADVLVLGTSRVNIAVAVDQLFDLGCKTILSEGGPNLNGQLVESNVVDEWNLSISPFLVGGPSPRPATGPPRVETPTAMKLNRLWQGDEMLFGRWVKSTEPTGKE